jgi:hypothetical protein
LHDLKKKADTAPTFREYENFMKEYEFLKRRWDYVSGNAIIGIEINPKKKCRLCGMALRGTNEEYQRHLRVRHDINKIIGA